MFGRSNEKDNKLTYLFIFQFYADDRRDKANVITTHSFGTVVASRYIRIVASTDVRWIGEAEKCFRFEILGTYSSHVFTNPEFSICNSFFKKKRLFDKNVGIL